MDELILSFLRGEGGKTVEDTHYTCGNHRHITPTRQAFDTPNIGAWGLGALTASEPEGVDQDCEDDAPEAWGRATK